MAVIIRATPGTRATKATKPPKTPRKNITRPTFMTTETNSRAKRPPKKV